MTGPGRTAETAPGIDSVGTADRLSPTEQRAGKKDLTRLERLIARLDQREAQLHDQMATHATDYEKVTALDAELRETHQERAQAEEEWLLLAERLGDA